MQLAEVELLQSMYSEEELKLSDPMILEDFRAWMANPTDHLPTTISFVICLDFEAHVCFPHDYPEVECAKVFVRSSKLTRDNQLRLNNGLTSHLEKAFEPDCAVVNEVISWLNDNFPNYLVQSKSEEKADAKIKAEIVIGARLWLYSHHIYSKTKRKNILDLCKDNHLTGFCMPGKPGIVCLEGQLDICNDVWSIIKQWNWKKINVNFQEDQELPDFASLDKWKKFDKFEEIGFVKSETRDYHMDMGEFYKYLQSHDVDYMFKELFGIGKS